MLGAAMAARLDLPFRSCGEVVKSAALAAGIAIDSVPAAEHDRIDQESRDWAAEAEPRLIEGRYLDQVLATTLLGTWLVQLTAPLEVRAERAAQRANASVTLREMTAIDASDEAFRLRHYPGVARLQPTMVLETGGKSESDCLEELLRRWGEVTAPRG